MEKIMNAAERAMTLYQTLLQRTDMPHGTLLPPGRMLCALRFVPSPANQNYDAISISTPFDHNQLEIALFKDNQFVRCDETYEDTVARFPSVDAVVQELQRLVSL